MKDYGGALKRLRKHFGYTQQQLAEKLNVSFQTVSKWETGTNGMDLDTVRITCGVFGISLDAFISIADGTAVSEVLAQKPEPVAQPAPKPTTEPAPVAQPEPVVQPASEPAPAPQTEPVEKPAPIQQPASPQPIVTPQSPQAVTNSAPKKPIEKYAAILALALAAVIIAFVIATIAVFAPRSSGLGDYFDLQKGSPVTVSFNLGGASGSMADEEYKNGVVKLPYCDGSRKGYRFDGWLYDGKVYQDGEKITGLGASHITVTAKWRPIKYTIKFINPNGSSTMPSVTAEYGKSVTLPKSKYTYKGAPMLYWDCVDNSERYDDCDTVSNLTWLDDDTITLEACWDTVRFHIWFKGNGGDFGEYSTSFNSDKPAEVKDYGWRKSGYVFVGWKCGDKIFYNGDAFTGLSYRYDQYTMTAVWKYDGPEKFYIKYRCNMPGCDGSGDAADEHAFSETRGYTLRNYCDGKHAGYEIDYLTVTQGIYFSGTYEVGASLDMSSYSSQNVVVETRFKPIEVAVIVKYMDSSGGYYDGYSWEYGTNIVDGENSLNLYAKKGYRWRAGKVYVNDEEYTGDMRKVTTNKSDKIVVEYAQEPITYIVRYEYTNEYKYITYTYGEEFTMPVLPPDSEHVGYKFRGWIIWRDAYVSGTTVSNLTDKSETLEAEAWWVGVEYTIQFDANGGSGTPPPTVQRRYDSVYSYTIPKNPFTRDGYEFIAWESDFDGNRYRPNNSVQDLSNVEGSVVTLKAVWVKYDGDGSEQSPYQIGSYEDLYDLYWYILLNDNGKKNYVLTADIDCEGKPLYPLYDNYSYAAGFSGVFDGDNHVIKNADFRIGVIGYYSEKHIGLFGCVYGGTICNLGIADYTLDFKSRYNYYTVGPLAAEVSNSGSKISRVWASGSVTVQTNDYRGYLGGLVGRLSGATVEDCFSTGSISVTIPYQDSACEQNIGGFAGMIYGPKITRCYADMDITVTTDVKNSRRDLYIGGLFGKRTGGNLDNLFVSGSAKVPNNCNFDVIVYGYTVDSAVEIYVCADYAITNGEEEVEIPTEYSTATFEDLCAAEWLKSNLDFDTDEVWQTAEDGLPTLRGFAVQPAYSGGDAQ